MPDNHEIAAALAKVERHELEVVGRGYMAYNDMVNSPWGRWVRLEDVYKALGLEVPSDV